VFSVSSAGSPESEFQTVGPATDNAQVLFIDSAVHAAGNSVLNAVSDE